MNTMMPDQEQADLRLQERMSKIRHKLVVLSGKGGVGKSTVAANLAISLASTGKSVGLLDVDIHGPSISEIMNLHELRYDSVDGTNIIPIERGPLKVVSVGPLLQSREAAAIFRGPMKHNMIRQFLTDVEWGELDFLVIDSPPGTGDEPLSVCQLIENPSGAVLVTTPQQLSVADVRRSISFCRKLGMPVLGIVENMSGFVCPSCGERVDIFARGGGEALATEMNVPFLGAIPIDIDIARSGDAGIGADPCGYQAAGEHFTAISASLLEELETAANAER
jgi:ATP-binding protein involved in chromosome partitioning